MTRAAKARYRAHSSSRMPIRTGSKLLRAVDQAAAVYCSRPVGGRSEEVEGEVSERAGRGQGPELGSDFNVEMAGFAVGYSGDLEGRAGGEEREEGVVAGAR